ncbi:hypothetical protein WA171_006050 [Blastocystis sp. BT1]
MFKAKRRRGTLRQVDKEDDSDTGIDVDIEKIKKEQKMRNEIKSGLSTDVLLKGTGIVIDPLAQHVGDEEIRGTNESDTEEKKDLLKYIKDESEIYKPEGIVIPDIVPEPVTEKDRMDMDIDMIVEIKEVEIVDAAHCETMEEIARLKRKMTKELKRERREVFESKF